MHLKNGIASLNIIYADRDNNIMYIDNGQKKKQAIRLVACGANNTSTTLWKNDYYPYDSLAKSDKS